MLAQRLALAPPALPSCFHMQYQSQTGRRPPPRKHLGRARCTPVLAAPSWGRAGGLGPLYLPFSFRPGWGGNETPKKQQKTHRIGDYLFVFNLFCHIFVKRQKCNKKYISTVPKGGAAERGLPGPNDKVGASSSGNWQAQSGFPFCPETLGECLRTGSPGQTYGKLQKSRPRGPLGGAAEPQAPSSAS